MNNTLVTTICIAAALVVATILFKECGKPAVRIVETERIKEIRDTVYKYDKTKFRDTFTRIRTEYRNRILQTTLWVYDSTRNQLCDSFAGGATDSVCFRILVRRLVAERYERDLNAVYQAQREEDSSQIAFMFELDSLTTEAHLSEVKGLKGEIVQAKRKSGRKAVKFALGGALVGFILGKI